MKLDDLRKSRNHETKKKKLLWDKHLPAPAKKLSRELFTQWELNMMVAFISAILYMKLDRISFHLYQHVTKYPVSFLIVGQKDAHYACYLNPTFLRFSSR